jgi:hypothetical protein
MRVWLFSIGRLKVSLAQRPLCDSGERIAKEIAMQSRIHPPLRAMFDHQMLVKLKLNARPKVMKRRHKPSLKLNM